MDTPADIQLIRRYLRQKDELALESLIQRYLPLIFGYTRKYTGNPDTASDITQEVFLKVWKNLRSFDDTKSFRTWIFTIAKNTSIDWMKKKRALPVSSLEGGEDLMDSLTDESLSTSSLVSQSMTSRDLALAINKLPKDYRVAITYRTEQDLSFSEIAKKLREPLNTVKSRYRRGISLLRQIIKR